MIIKGSRKKNPPLLAGPLRKKKLFFKRFFIILLPFNLSKYGNITLKYSLFHITGIFGVTIVTKVPMAIKLERGGGRP